MEATNLDDLYGAPFLDWDRIEARLDEGLTQAPALAAPNRHTVWLVTINPDGKAPRHRYWRFSGSTAPSGSRPATALAQAQNLARDRRSSVSVATHEFDLVVGRRGAQGHRSADRRCHGGALGRPRGGQPAVDDTGQALTAEFSAQSSWPAALVRVPPRAPQSDGVGNRRAVRSNTLALLTERRTANSPPPSRLFGWVRVGSYRPASGLPDICPHPPAYLPRILPLPSSDRSCEPATCAAIAS